MEESGPCPLCFKSFSYAQLPEHAATCTGESSSPDRSTSSSHHDADLELALRLQAEEEGRGTAAATTTSSSTAAAGQKRNYEDTLSADEEFARKLQEEEEARNRPQGVRCQICTEVTSMERLYILDECTHKFCKDCLKESVRVQVTKSATTVCPLQGCGAALSVRDMKDMMPTSSEIAPSGKGSQQATERLLQEFKAILKTKPEKQGYSVKPLKDNLYHWEVKFFDFDPKDPIGQDLARSKHVRVPHRLT
ncbi:UBC core domain-containing protein, variant 2 [Balamuthia mandrillaris]